MKSNPNPKTALLRAALVGCLAHVTSAAEPTPSTELLPTTVITATREESERSKTAASVGVVTREDLTNGQFSLLPDALRSLPGLQVITPGLPGQVATLLNRGTTTKDTLMLLDGRPVPMNLAGTFHLEMTSLDLVERVEVLRGPAASLYGGRSMGGVVQILTRTGQGLEKPENTVFFEAGSYGHFREGLSSLGSSGAFDWALSLSRADIQGQRENSRYEQSQGSAHLGYQLAEDLRLDFLIQSYQTQTGVPGSVLVNDPNDRLQTEYLSLSPRFVWTPDEALKHTFTYAFSHFTQVADGFTGFQVDNKVETQQHWLEYQVQWSASEKLRFTGGVALQEQNLTRFNESLAAEDVNQNYTNWAVFLQAQWELVDGLNFESGVRYDAFSDFKDAWTWRTGLNYKIPHWQTVVRASYGTSYTPPTPQDLTPVFGGNPDLVHPERSRGWEVGIEQPFLADKAAFSVTWFQNKLSNTYQYLPPFFLPQAVGRAETQGIESQLTWQVVPSLRAQVSYSFLEADDLTNEVRLVRRPSHTFSASLNWKPTAKLSLGLQALWMLDREDYDPLTFAQVDQEDFLNLRLMAQFQVNEKVEVYGRIENLLGDEYAEIPGFPTLDTGAYVGVRVKF